MSNFLRALFILGWYVLSFSLLNLVIQGFLWEPNQTFVALGVFAGAWSAGYLKKEKV